MSFACRPQNVVYAGSTSGVLSPIALLDETDTRSGGGTATWTITLTVLGKINWVANDNAGDETLQSVDWYLPESSVGNSYWCKLTRTNGTAPTGSTGWVHCIAAEAVWYWSRATAGSTTGKFNLQISSDSAGATILASENVNFTLTRA
jgi:hypothetical protein